MKLPHRKSKLQRVMEAVERSLEGADGLGQSVSRLSSNRRLKAALPDRARTAGLIAGGVAGLTAGSASISSYRRHQEEADHDS